MLDHTVAQLGLQNRLLTVVAKTTGVMTLGASSTGYTRSAGSFLADGFAVGMEVTPVGFTQTAVGVITALAADGLSMTIAGGRTIEAPAGGRTLYVTLPKLRAWENIVLDPLVGRPYVEADYVPATAQLLSCPSAGGTVEETGLYVVRLYGIANTGLLALSELAKAILLLFPPGGTLILSNGAVLRYRENPGPARGAVLADLPGFVVLPITIPWRLYTQN